MSLEVEPTFSFIIGHNYSGYLWVDENPFLALDAGMLTRPQPHEAEAEATTHEAEAEAEATTHEAEAEAEATTHEAEAEADNPR